MFSSKAFQIAFLISLITHSVILFQNTNFNLFSRQKKEEKIEVSYVKEVQKRLEQTKEVSPRKEPFLKLLSKITAEKRIPPPFIDINIDKENIFKQSRGSGLPTPDFTKPTFTKPDVIAVKKKITLPPIGIDKINNPSYISYYQLVREKIRRAAYQNYTRTDVGEVYLSFIISNDGILREMRLIEEKSSPNKYLRECALKSIKDASPFPDFPKSLDYPQLSFNVVISFEIE